MSAPVLESNGNATHAPTLIGVYTALALLSIVFLAARLYTRFRIVNAPGIDDLILTLNLLVLIIPHLVCTGIQVKYGFGRHIYYLSEHQIFMFAKWGVISEPFAALMSCVPKVAVVVFLHKCLAKTYRRSIYLLYGLITALSIVTILVVFLFFFQCRPFYAPWITGNESNCWDPHLVANLSFFVGALSALVDLVLALYPLTFVPQLQMKTKQKIGLCCVMGLGVFACGCAVARTTQMAAFQISADPSWDGTTLVLLAAVETNIVTICASLPAIVPLILNQKRSKNAPTKNSPSHPRTEVGSLHISHRRGRSISFESLETIDALEARKMNRKSPEVSQLQQRFQ